MILLVGIPSEPSLRFVHEACVALGEQVLMLNQRWVKETGIVVEVVDGTVSGSLSVGDNSYTLEQFGGVLMRPMDPRFLPELRTEPEGSALLRHGYELYEALTRWSQLADAIVFNRPDATWSNGSKPYQAQLIADAGFATPDTLVTSDPGEVLAFRSQHGRLIYKSVSGARSIVRELTDDDLPRLQDIQWCPVQFQQYIDGEDMRVHVVGSQTFATAISSDVTDYRYAGRGHGEPAQLRPVDLDDHLAERCVNLAATLELGFAGIDLRITRGGEVYCFEVNPSPAFSYYQGNTGQPIAAAVARGLAGRAATARR